VPKVGEISKEELPQLLKGSRYSYVNAVIEVVVDVL